MQSQADEHDDKERLPCAKELTSRKKESILHLSAAAGPAIAACWFGENLLEEFLDIAAENNQVIGQEKKSLVHQSGLWHRGVHIFLFTPEHKLVIQQRSRRGYRVSYLES